MTNLTENQKRTKEILEKYLGTYPCIKCDQFKKYERELNGAKQTTHFETVVEKFEDAIRFSHVNFIHHIEEIHLPTEEEWKIINK